MEGQEQTQTFTVTKPSSLPATQEDLDAQEDLLLRIHRQVDRTAKTLNTMRDLRQQLDGWAKRTKDDNAPVAEAAETLRDKILDVEKTLLSPTSARVGATPSTPAPASSTN